MKANEAPDKIYLVEDRQKHIPMEYWYNSTTDDSKIEYIRTDAFIEKACEFLKSYRQDTPDGFGYIAGIVNDKTIEEFRNYMKGE